VLACASPTKEVQVDKYYVIVAGNGVTTRANLEALMEDHFYANGEHGVVVLPYKDKPSQGQIFAAQLAKDKNKDIIIYTKSGNFNGIPTSTMVDGDTTDVTKDFIKEKTVAFLLWDDEDSESANLLADLKGIQCFDLTDGLNKIGPSEGLRIVAPIIPIQEQDIPKENPSAKEEEEDEEETDFSDLEDEEDEGLDEEVMENLYYGIQAVAQIFAQALVEAMADTPGKPLKGPEA
jgi:hypothetical protein